ncbi:dependent histone deacetylase SIR2 [Seminavis robusta]|uniref:Dependent histone deacetylase SIR2 n=1 Tax=Seminavis robusta TaxID=568900 RepID=A0A9N8HE21_9STRA|nr:dependent histone deacetylase SIR2 [Seminavis robusta]|eukprot:Sro386_g131910.1 dependent histone deacetylase SIR2 (590) ;mRNA; r:42462-44544
MTKKKADAKLSSRMHTRSKSLAASATTTSSKKDIPKAKGKRNKSPDDYSTSPIKNPTKRSCPSPSIKTAAKQAKTATSNNVNKAGPPFPLYRDVSKATVAEGIDSIVNLLRGRKNIVVLNGAGISVSCGIPDFRSRGSGLYSTLDPEDIGLSCPEELFDWEVFREDPRPFYKFARNLYFPLGSGENAQRVRPSDSHKLLAMLEQKKMLLRVYSQNIDGLEQVAGVSPKKMVYAHGSLQWASCLRCKTKVTAKEIEPAILKRTVPFCQEPVQGKGAGGAANRAASPPQLQPSRTRKRPRGDSGVKVQPFQDEGNPFTCGGVLKPGVTFFGEALNDTVRKSLESDRKKVDALIVIGTSLSVAPMSKVIGYMPANIPRILINRTIVHPKSSNSETENLGKHGSGSDDADKDFRDAYVFDAYMLGYCDDVTRLLAKRLFSADVSDMDETNKQSCEILSRVRERAALKNGDDDIDNPTATAGPDDEEDEELEAHKAEDWSFCTVPEDRVVLFPGADPSKGGYGDDGDEDDNNSDVTFREVAHCDGCTKRIEGTIHKCEECFDYDLCQKCFPKLSRTHYKGEHTFAAEPAAVVDL